MATEFLFNNQQVIEPGVYSTIKSQIQNPGLSLSYGNVLIIDTGSGASYGGAGINGELTNGANAVYQFDDIKAFQQFQRGGVWWDAATALFRPNGNGTNGVSRIYYASARTSTASTLALNFTGASASTLTIKGKMEGVGSVGVLSGTNLSTGFAATFVAGTIDPTKYVLKMWTGTYRGLHTDGTPLSGTDAANSTPLLIAQSGEVSTVAELVTWAASNANFKQYFTVTASTGTGTFDAADALAVVGYNLFAGGTDVYNATDVDAVLDVVKELDYSIVLADQIGATSAGTANMKIYSHLVTEAKFDKMMIVGGGDESADFAGESIATAVAYDSENVVVVHGGINTTSPNPAEGLREQTSLLHAAYVTGRTAGLAPQTPLTFKAMNFQGVRHILKDSERIQAIQSGVLASKWDSEFSAFVIVAGVNSLQANTYLVNTDATTPEVSIFRIKAQLNKELIVNSKLDLLGNQTSGPNQATLRKEDVVEWMNGFLSRRTADDTTDNLIIRYTDIAVTVDQDAYQITYKFVPNFPVTKLLFTGFMIES